jgi:hypothetical protein
MHIIHAEDVAQAPVAATAEATRRAPLDARTTEPAERPEPSLSTPMRARESGNGHPTRGEDSSG